jgi:hypothetical protein
MNKSGLDNLLQSLLSIAMKEQNMDYPPTVFSSHINIVTSFVLSGLAKIYPSNQGVIDILDPFVEGDMIPVNNGYVQLPDGYRNLLGSPMVFANPSGKEECGDIQPLTKENFKSGMLKAACKVNPIVIVPQSEFAYLTRSKYNFPTYENPIGYYSGEKRIKVCPYDLTKVFVLYIRNEETYRYAYQIQPDDTYLFDPANSIETEWDSNSFDILLKGLVSLYAAYAKDPDMRDYSKILNMEGLL